MDSVGLKETNKHMEFEGKSGGGDRGRTGGETVREALIKHYKHV